MSAGSPSLAAVDPSDPVSPAADCSRHGLFRYLTAEESADYLAIMDLFSATLLVDLSAAEVTAQLAERGGSIDRDTVEARCRQLVAWGNLVPAVRDARVSTVAEYIRSRSRYQVSKPAGACTARQSPSCTPVTARVRWHGSCSARSFSPSNASWRCWTGARSMPMPWPAR
jgi:Protein of unknown function (DUF2397)